MSQESTSDAFVVFDDLVVSIVTSKGCRYYIETRDDILRRSLALNADH